MIREKGDSLSPSCYMQSVLWIISRCSSCSLFCPSCSCSPPPASVGPGNHGANTGAMIQLDPSSGELEEMERVKAENKSSSSDTASSKVNVTESCLIQLPFVHADFSQYAFVLLWSSTHSPNYSDFIKKITPSAPLLFACMALWG